MYDGFQRFTEGMMEMVTPTFVSRSSIPLELISTGEKGDAAAETRTLIEEACSDQSPLPQLPSGWVWERSSASLELDKVYFDSNSVPLVVNWIAKKDASAEPYL